MIRLALCLAFVLTWSQATIAQSVPPVMRVETLTTDMSGNPIDSINVGESYKLRLIVTDIRDPAPTDPQWRGVFSGGADIAFDDSLSSLDVNQTVTSHPFFALSDTALEPNRAILWAQTFSAYGPGNDPQPMFDIVLVATNPGLQVFNPTADLTPNHDYNLYVFPEVPLPHSYVQFVGSTLQIVPEPGALAISAVGLGGLVLLARRRTHRKA